MIRIVRRARHAMLATTLFLPLAGAVHAQSAEAVLGRWMGTLDVGGTALRLALELSMEDALSAVLLSVDQGNQPIPVESVTFEGGQLAFSAPAASLSYAGTLAQDGATIEGTFTQMGNDLPLSFERQDGPAEGPTRPQDPEEPYPYHVEDVSYTNPDGGHTLAGTFTRPRGDGSHPAVVLISGSGPQDRNEALMGHRPFLVLSDHLTRAGIAVLRFDDRGVGESAGDFSTATSWDFASDVRAGIAYLQSRNDVDPARIGLAGHSEGGLIAPMVAAESDEVAFLVLMAGPGVTGERILYAQAELIARASGAADDRVALGRSYQERIYGILKSDLPPDEAAAALEVLAREQMAALTPEELAQSGVTEDNRDQIISAQIQSMSSPWFRTFLTYDPAESLERVSAPVLAINGEKDLQVPYEENLREIGAALERGGNDRFELHALPGLNHLFQTAETGHPSEYGTIEETWSPDAMDRIAEWILETVGPVG